MISRWNKVFWKLSQHGTWVHYWTLSVISGFFLTICFFPPQGANDDSTDYHFPRGLTSPRAGGGNEANVSQVFLTWLKLMSRGHRQCLIGEKADQCQDRHRNIWLNGQFRLDQMCNNSMFRFCSIYDHWSGEHTRWFPEGSNRRRWCRFRRSELFRHFPDWSRDLRLKSSVHKLTSLTYGLQTAPLHVELQWLGWRI